MKITITIISLLFCLSISSQDIESEFATKKDIEFYYKDSVNGEFAYGDYEPTSIVEHANNGFLISAKLSISFPNQYKTPASYDSIYFQKQKRYREKSHVSSGCLIKLDNNLEKEWERIYKGKRINKILTSKEGSIFIIGERADLKKNWISKVNLQGETIWEKEFKAQYHNSFADASIDSLGNILVLIESERLIPIRYTKMSHYSRKSIQFFKVDEMRLDLHIVNFDSFGNKKWSKTLEKRKNISSYGYKIVLNSNQIYVSSRYTGFEKHKGENKSIEGKFLYELSSKEKLVSKSDFNDSYLLFYDNGIISCKGYTSDSINFYRNGVLVKSNYFLNLNWDYWIRATKFKPNEKLILGTLSNNLGYRFMKTDNNYSLTKVWTNNQNRSCEAVDFIETNRNSIILIGKKWIKENSQYIRCINIVEIENGA